MSDDRKLPAPARPSATIMLVRDGADGIEIFMVKRDRMVDLASGALIFPGGKVEEDDANVEIPWGTSLFGPEPKYWIAAVRETFEEAGVLIAAREGDPDVVEEAVARVLEERHRVALNAKTMKFSEFMRQHDLVPAFDHMVHFAHWTSPETLAKRFDTHFFLVEMPDGQLAEHDGSEAVSSAWCKPADLLSDAESGREFLVPATRLNIELLSESRTVREAMAAARARTAPEVMPVLRKDERGVRAVIPADAGYKTTEVFVSKAG
ncbi:MAG TPA: NUDIX domain-containing protein [Hyphomicrobiaceae bacterium]|nr:NUDIX domain-containing protein [Hyphomicrobiaceae bacterium]